MGNGGRDHKLKEGRRKAGNSTPGSDAVTETLRWTKWEKAISDIGLRRVRSAGRPIGRMCITKGTGDQMTRMIKKVNPVLRKNA